MRLRLCFLVICEQLAFSRRDHARQLDLFAVAPFILRRVGHAVVAGRPQAIDHSAL
jgi:hypothetical protein